MQPRGFLYGASAPPMQWGVGPVRATTPHAQESYKPWFRICLVLGLSPIMQDPEVYLALGARSAGHAMLLVKGQRLQDAVSKSSGLQDCFDASPATATT